MAAEAGFLAAEHVSTSSTRQREGVLRLASYFFNASLRNELRREWKKWLGRRGWHGKLS